MGFVSAVFGGPVNVWLSSVFGEPVISSGRDFVSFWRTCERIGADFVSF